jgi:hypothetical protein
MGKRIARWAKDMSRLDGADAYLARRHETDVCVFQNVQTFQSYLLIL